MGITISESCHIPFASEGSTIFFNSSYASNDGMDSFPHMVLTSDTPWDPCNLVMPGGTNNPDRFARQVQSHTFRHLHETESAHEDTERLLMERIINSVTIDYGQSRHAANSSVTVLQLHSSRRHSQFTPEHISKIWNVGLGMAKDILATTTQKGVRHTVLPINQRYRIDHLNLHAHYLDGSWK